MMPENNGLFGGGSFFNVLYFFKSHFPQSRLFALNKKSFHYGKFEFNNTPDNDTCHHHLMMFELVFFLIGYFAKVLIDLAKKYYFFY